MHSMVTEEEGESLRAWSGDTPSTLICHAIRDDTHDVRSFFFRDAGGRLFRHLPGQFLTFAFDIDGRTVHRCYTISSPPTRPDMLSITVKRKPDGVVSPWLHANLHAGDTVQASGPSGDFSCSLHVAPKYLFVSGGSGITPVMSMARYLDDMHVDADIVFVHAARTPRDIIFREELGEIARRRPRLHNIFVCEDAPGVLVGDCYAGRLTSDLLQTVADLSEREVFCCGPAPFMSSVRDILARAGHDPSRYHSESFSVEAVAQATVARNTPVADAGTYSIRFSVSGKTVVCGPDQTVLSAAQAAGIRIPTACTMGLCGTCKSRLLEGSVDMRHQGGIHQREIDQGKILACCSFPQSDLVIER